MQDCVVCKKFEGKPFDTPETAQLPPNRVSDEPPFANTEVDFTGSLYIDTQIKDGMERKITTVTFPGSIVNIVSGHYCSRKRVVKFE